MAASVPTALPDQFTAGDTFKALISLSDYSPSDGWVLSYSFLRFETGDQINITATTSSGSFLVNESVNTTIGWNAGKYKGQGYVTKASTNERYKVWEGQIEILPNFVDSGQIDVRTRARKILDFIECSFEKLVKRQTVTAIIEGVELHFRTLKELQEARNYWAPIVAAEEGRSRRTILAQFTRPQ